MCQMHDWIEVSYRKHGAIQYVVQGCHLYLCLRSQENADVLLIINLLKRKATTWRDSRRQTTKANEFQKRS